MSISQIAVRRILEDRADEDAELRQDLARQGRPLLRDARALSDDDLLAKAASLGFTITRSWLDEMSGKYVAAWRVAELVQQEHTIDERNLGEDWLWFVVICLWERWFPDRPSMEMIDDLIQDGYDASDDAVEACRIWDRAWRFIQEVMAACRLDSITAFDNAFGGMHSVFNWIQDYENELINASRDDRQLARQRLELCQTVLGLPDDNDTLLPGFRRRLADAHCDLGDRAKADELYAGWLAEQPQWGWGWIGWSDIYFIFAPEERKDPERAIEILQRGLATPQVTDRAMLLDRLADIYEETGRDDEAVAAKTQRDALTKRDHQPPNATMSITRTGAGVKAVTALDFGEEGLPLEELDRLPDMIPSADRMESAGGQSSKPRVGRNQPCPCGSGKKFKKCCGRR